MRGGTCTQSTFFTAQDFAIQRPVLARNIGRRWGLFNRERNGMCTRIKNTGPVHIHHHLSRPEPQRSTLTPASDHRTEKPMRTLDSLRSQGRGSDPTENWQTKMLNAINALRRQHGLNPLTWSPGLEQIAEKWSAEMRRTSPHHQKMGNGLRAENIAWGYRTGEDVLQGWLNSPGHRANILSPNVSHIGVARVGNYWTMDFS